MIGANQCKIKNSKCKILHFTFYILHSKKGFTLMEMLVALGLFSVIVVIAADLFLTFQRVSRKTESLEQVAADARFVVERIAREVREGTVDYSAYVTPLDQAQAQNVLHLRNSTNAPVSFLHINNTITLNGEELTGAQVRVRELRFFVQPAQNPFELVTDRSDARAGQYQANVQPMVTLFLSLENLRDPSDSNYVSYDVQTTISSRVYRR